MGLYTVLRKWSLAERFTIIDEAGVARFEVRGNMVRGQPDGTASLLDESGRELAEIRAHIFTPALKIFADGGVAEVDRGFVRGRYGINSSGV